MVYFTWISFRVLNRLVYAIAIVYKSVLTSRYGTDTNPVLLEDVYCSTSNYLVLLQCSYSYQYSSYCNDHSRDAFVVCCK